jgi:competence protein ComEC
MHTGPITRIPSRSGLRTAPLFHAAWLFACGIVVARWVWLRPGMVLIAAALAATLCCVAGLRALRIAWLPLAALWVLLGAWCGLMEPQPAPSPALAAVSDDLLRAVQGTVVSTGPVRAETEENVDAPATESPTQRIDVQVASVEQVTDTYDGQAPVAGRVRLTVRWPSTGKAVQAFRCGERIRAVVRLLPPETYHDPGVWNRASYLLDQGIAATASVAVDRVETLGASPERLAGCRLAEWQHDTAARLLALPGAMRRLPSALRLTPDDAAMLAAMIAGDRTYLAQSLRVGFERTGSFHMLVVSGLHLAIVAGCLFWVLRKVRLGRGPATFATIAGSFAYALFTGFATPVQRSLWMISLYLLARLVYRERNTLNTIGFAALCLLAASPRSLFDAGLQMTLLAVIAIGGVAAPLLAATVQPYVRATRNLRTVAIDTGLPPKLAQFRVTVRMFATRLQAAANSANSFVAWRAFPWTLRCLLRVVELVAISCVVELAMTLPMAFYFHRITLFALPVNLLILPLLALLLPAALLMLLVLLAWPAAAVVPAMAVALLLHLGAGLVRVFGSLALANLRVATPLLWQTALFCALLAAAVVLAHSGRWARRAAWAALLLAALGAMAPRPPEHPAHALLVEAIDVGQGDSILLIAPDGKTLLVDGGGPSGGPGGGLGHAAQEFDIGEEVVSPALWARGIQHLDAVALTHAHSDHMGGLPAVLRNFHPRQLWVGNNPPVPSYKALLAEAARLHVQVRSFHAGEGFSWGGIRVNVLAPLMGYQPGLEPSNDDSLVLHVAYGASSVLLEGDAEAPVERAMLSEPGLASSLLKVGHHGSITSTRPEFLARVEPRWAVISCGPHNRYGHPRQEVLDELEAAHVRTLRTDIGGMACFVLNGTSAAPDFRCGWRWGP